MTMPRTAAASIVALSAAAIVGCGDGVSTPIDSPSGEQSAATIVDNLELFASAPGGDDVLYAIGTISRELSNLVAVKLDSQSLTPTAPAPLAGSTDACLVETDSLIRYQGCSYNGLEVNGYVSLYERSGTVNLTMSDTGNGFQPAVDIGITGGITFNRYVVVVEDDNGEPVLDEDGEEVVETYYRNLAGDLSFNAEFGSNGAAGTTDLRAAFKDIEQDAGCPIGGGIDVFQSSRTNSTTDNVFVNAGFGPGCGDVELR